MGRIDVDAYVRGRLTEHVTRLLTLLNSGRSYTTREAAVRILAQESFRRADLLRDVAAGQHGEAAALLLEAAELIEEHPEEIDARRPTQDGGA